jgi:hypothetical protein
MNYEPGTFGHATFTHHPKWFSRGIDCYGTIEKVEDEHVHFKDNDGFKYKIRLNEFEFEKCERNDIQD